LYNTRIRYAGINCESRRGRRRRRHAPRLHERKVEWPYLRVHSEEAESLYQDLQAGETGFFQHPETFSALKEHFFRKIIQRHASSKPLRVWLPGCGTAEDAYSTAIAFYEFAENSEKHTAIEIFVTDSNLKTIERARAGIYSQHIVGDVSPERLSRFFLKKGD